MAVRAEGPQQLRLTELLASISLATDLGTGQPLGHALRTCALATGLATAMGCSIEDVRTVHHASLLRFVGCTSDAAETAAMTGGDDISFNAGMAPALMGSDAELLGRLTRVVGAGRPLGTRARLVAAALADPGGGATSMATHCEVGAMLGTRIGMPAPVVEALAHAYERWDGKGPDGLEGEAVPLAVRVFAVARDIDLAARSGEDPLDWMRQRRGRAYDPGVVDVATQESPLLLEALTQADEWDAAMEAEPVPRRMVTAGGLEGALTALADFVDLKSPWLRGHSRQVAMLAGDAAALAGLDAGGQVQLRRSALVHDVGRVGVPNGIWDKPGPLTSAEHERVRLHPYLTSRILERCATLGVLAEAASAHHERLDGGGYHRGLAADGLSLGSRILAAADVFAALVADRPHRPAHSRVHAVRMLKQGVGAQLDGDAVACVVAAAGEGPPPAPSAWPAGLTDREVEVLRLIARGASNKVVAARLVISPKTVGRHVENLYRKLGVSSRAAAAVVAMEHHLLD